MRWLVVLATLLAAAPPARANQPPPTKLSTAWDQLVSAAEPELARCKTLGGTTYGDIEVAYDVDKHRWSGTSSKSLGALGPKILGCVRAALARSSLSYDVDDRDHISALGSLNGGFALTHRMTIGIPVPVLPPAATILPVWRRAIGTAADADAARAELARLLPPDYWLTWDACLETDRDAIAWGQLMWLPTAGPRIPKLWHAALADLLGGSAHAAVWSAATSPSTSSVARAPGEIVWQRGKALCLVPFDAAMEAALRATMELTGACWVGEFEEVLLRPRVAFPTDARYTSVSTHGGRTCATTTAGDVVCCGANVATMPPPVTPLRSVALGAAFGCGLDARGTAICWGDLGDTAPPPGALAMLSAGDREVCGVRPSGEVVCWGNATSLRPPPEGTFTQVAVTQDRACALRRDGAVACWGPSNTGAPRGAFSSVVASWTHACGVRGDGVAACWDDATGRMTFPLPDEVTELALASASDACGRRRDGTLVCSWGRISAPPTPAPAGRMIMLTGHRQQICGVRDDRSIACWGDPWPTRSASDNTWPDTRALVEGLPEPGPTSEITGRVLDERGRPLAGVEVVVCNDHGPCGDLASQARASSLALSDLVDEMTRLRPGDVAIARTGDDGRWRATFAIRPTYAGDKVLAVFAGRGRELVERDSSYLQPASLGADLVLRPAADLDVAATCDGASCSGAIEISEAPYKWHEGTALAHLTPGVHVVRVTIRRGKPGERRGELAVEVPYGRGALRRTVGVRPVGTGESIRGTASLGDQHVGVTVIATCERADDPVIRTARTGDDGRFELADVGDPPCTLQVSGGSADPVVVEALPVFDVAIQSRRAIVPIR